MSFQLRENNLNCTNASLVVSRSIYDVNQKTLGKTRRDETNVNGETFDALTRNKSFKNELGKRSLKKYTVFFAWENMFSLL